MLRRICAVLLIAAFASANADESAEVFSGPQPGEETPSLTVNRVRGDDLGKPIDLVAEAKDGPLVIVFFHEKTRPAFGLTNAVARFAETRAEKGLKAAIVYLTADATETENWLKTVNQMLPSKVILGISPDGQEGPGAWGLNRNVAVTVVVADKGKVTANFALRQPSLDVDGPKIIQAIADITGGGPVPKVSELSGQSRRMEAGRGNGEKPDSDREALDAKLRTFLRPVINKSATDEEVDAAAKKVEDEAAKDPAFRERVAQSAGRIIEADKLTSYGTPKAQEYLARWAKEFAEPTDEKSPDEKPADEKK